VVPVADLVTNGCYNESELLLFML